MGPALDDDTPLSLGPRVRRGCPWPQPRHPAALMGRRPRPLLPSAVAHRAAPRRRVGGQARSAEAVSVMTGLVPRHHPRSARPRHSAPEGGHRPTTRPAREPCLTGPSLRGGEPAALRMATGPGTNAYRDRPGHRPRHSRPAPRGWAAGVRMSVGCGSSVAVGPGAASAADNKPGRSQDHLRHGRCHPGADAQKASSFQGGGIIVS